MLPHISPIHSHREDIGADYFTCGSQLVFHCSTAMHCSAIAILSATAFMWIVDAANCQNIEDFRSSNTIGLIHFDGMISGVEAWIIFFHFCLQYLIQLMGIVIFQTLRSTGDGFSPQQKLDEIAD